MTPGAKYTPNFAEPTARYPSAECTSPADVVMRQMAWHEVRIKTNDLAPFVMSGIEALHLYTIPAHAIEPGVRYDKEREEVVIVWREEV